MAESAVHMEYVKQLWDYVKGMLTSDEHVHILVDTPSSSYLPPAVVNNYRPDLYYNHDLYLIIGEAKTDEDFDRPHSVSQYKAYFDECQSFMGMSIVVFSCSWRVSSSFANLVRNIRRLGSYRTKVYIINELGLFRVVE